MTRQTRTFFIIPLLLYFRLFVPLVQCEISGPAWESRGSMENSFGETSSDKDSVRSLPNNIKADSESLWTSLGDNSGVGGTSKDLIDLPGSGYPMAQASFSDTFGRNQNQGGDLRLQSPRKLQQQMGLQPYDSYDDIAQQLQLLEENNQSPLPTLQRTRMKLFRPEGYRRYTFSNLKRARDGGYMCHFKLCQVGVSGKRLSM